MGCYSPKEVVMKRLLDYRMFYCFFFLLSTQSLFADELPAKLVESICNYENGHILQKWHPSGKYSQEVLKSNDIDMRIVRIKNHYCLSQQGSKVTTDDLTEALPEMERYLSNRQGLPRLKNARVINFLLGHANPDSSRGRVLIENTLRFTDVSESFVADSLCETYLGSKCIEFLLQSPLHLTSQEKQFVLGSSKFNADRTNRAKAGSSKDIQSILDEFYKTNDYDQMLMLIGQMRIVGSAACVEALMKRINAPVSKVGLAVKTHIRNEIIQALSVLEPSDPIFFDEFKYAELYGDAGNLDKISLSKIFSQFPTYHDVCQYLAKLNQVIVKKYKIQPQDPLEDKPFIYLRRNVPID